MSKYPCLPLTICTVYGILCFTLLFITSKNVDQQRLSFFPLLLCIGWSIGWFCITFSGDIVHVLTKCSKYIRTRFCYDLNHYGGLIFGYCWDQFIYILFGACWFTYCYAITNQYYPK